MYPTNRKYLGSKRLLAPWICNQIEAVAGLPLNFLDGFSGTGAIAIEMMRRGVGQITCVDILLSNTTVLESFFTPLPKEEVIKLYCLTNKLQLLPGTCGYVTNEYAGRYFTKENAMRIDAIREGIQYYNSIIGSKIIMSNLLGSLILGVDKVANTVGQYDSFLKNIGHKSIVRGKHLVDSRVYKDIKLVPLNKSRKRATVINKDILESVRTLDVEVAYFDPPYNSRQYCDNYHVLENIARWEKPLLNGKTRKFSCLDLKSPFSRKIEVKIAFDRLISNCRAPWIFVSYGSEGLLEISELQDLLGAFGKVSIYNRAYSVFGNGAGLSKRRSVMEYLIALDQRR